jgi:hypothetical protein
MTDSSKNVHDYESIAAILAAEISVNRHNPDVVMAVRNIVLSIADMYRRDSSRFNRSRFYRAAGLEADGSINQ